MTLHEWAANATCGSGAATAGIVTLGGIDATASAIITLAFFGLWVIGIIRAATSTTTKG